MSGIDLVACSGVAPPEALRAAAGAGFVAVDWFDPRPYLGERGYKYLTPASRMLASAMVGLEAGWNKSAAPGSVGVLIGTNFGNLDVLAGFAETIEKAGAENLQPMEAPNFSINVPASQLAIRGGFHAFNMTLTEDTRAGLDALVEGVRAIQDGRADRVVAGGVEPTLPTAALANDAEQALTRHLGASLFLLQASDAARPGTPRLLRTRRAGLLDPLSTHTQFLARLLDGLPTPASVVLCAPDSSRHWVAEFLSLGASAEPGVSWRGVGALSCMAALHEVRQLSQAVGVHALLCRDRHGALTGVVVQGSSSFSAPVSCQGEPS